MPAFILLSRQFNRMSKMSNSQSPKDQNKAILPSKDVPWFQAEIGSSLTEEGRRLLEDYSKIPHDEIEDHIYKIVSVLYHSLLLESCLLVTWGTSLQISFRSLQYSLLITRTRTDRI